MFEPPQSDFFTILCCVMIVVAPCLIYPRYKELTRYIQRGRRCLLAIIILTYASVSTGLALVVAVNWLGVPWTDVEFAVYASLSATVPGLVGVCIWEDSCIPSPKKEPIVQLPATSDTGRTRISQWQGYPDCHHPERDEDYRRQGR